MLVSAGKFDNCVSFDIISEGQTEVTDIVPGEIEFLRANYDDIRVVERDGFYPMVLLTIDSASQPGRRVTLEISIVCGYPFVPPKVRIFLPPGVTPGCDGALSASEARQLQADIRESISPCILAGAPCLMQIISVVQRVISSDTHCLHTPTVAQNECVKVSTAVGEGTKWEILRLSVLLLHLLNRCCHFKNPESKEEASSNFHSLVQYLINDRKLISRGLQKCASWKYEYVKRVFGDTIKECMDGSDHLVKWMWSHEEGTCTFQRVSAGRYSSEFIEQHLLGSGGFAPVYVSRKKVDGRLYAVKKIPIRKNDSEKALREVQSLAALNHKHIVRYYDAWIEPGCEEELMNYALDNEEGDDVEEVSGSTSSTSTERRSKNCFLTGGSPKSKREDDYDEDEELTDASVYSSNHSSSSSINDEEGDNILDELQSPMHTHKEGDFSTLYIQMELCSKQSLRHMIDQCDKEEGGLLTAGDGDKAATKIFRQLLTAVSHFHRQGIVHRDLKPDNILFEIQSSVDSDDVGTIRVADFGLARTLHRTMKRSPSNVEIAESKAAEEAAPCHSPTGNLGSVVYCAPEQERGELYDLSVDEYSLGMIALEMWLAVAGKGFRERFNIMSDVSRGKLLPQWFFNWNSRIAEIIASLLELDPNQRRSCEEILNKADLPGDPADVVEALDTINRHGERFSGRVLHCVRQVALKQYHKPLPQAREAVKTLTNTVTLNLIQAANIIGILHGAVPLALVDPLVPMNAPLDEYDIPCLIDMSSTVWAFPQQPQLATAYFLALLTSSHVGFFYHFHYRTRPYAVFTSSCVAGAIEGMFMDPMLSFLHLLSVADLHSKVDIIVSHADWFNALHTKATGSVESLDQLDELCEPIEPSKSIGSTLDRIDSILSTGNRISSSHDRLGTLKSFTLWLTEVLPLFGKQITTNVRICINPSLRPTETSVDGTFIEQGLFMECRTRDKGRAIAFLCTMENFIGKCGARATDMQAVSLSVDLFALGEVCENIRFPQTDGLLFGGVAVRPQDVYSPGQKLSALAVSVNLWLDNIRSCLRTDQDIRGFRKAMKARGMQWVLQVGSQSASISLFHETKANTQTVDASSQDFCRIVRRHCSVERADSPVLFLKDSEKRVRTEEIRKLFTIIKRSLSHMLVVDFSAKKVGECIRIFSGDISAVPTAAVDGDRPVIPELLEWLKNNMPMYGVLPIYSVPDRTVTFTVDPKLLKSAVLVEQKPYRGGSRGDNSRKKK